MTPRALLCRVAIALVAVTAVAGCGSSSSSTTTVSGATPSGWTVYQGNGFSVAHPAGWMMHTAGPTGHTVVVFSNSSDTESASVIVRTGIYRQSTTHLVSQVRQALQGTFKSSQINGAAASVPGADHAELITDTGPSAGNAALIKDLWVEGHDGTQYEVSAEYQEHASGFDPTDFVNSFKIG